MRRLPRAVRWGLAGLLAFEALYLVAGAVLIHSGQVERWLNKGPEKRTIRFESLRSLVPFVAHVRGVHVVNQGRGDQIELVVDRATAFVNPVTLLRRHVRVSGLRADGVEFRLRKRPKTLEDTAREALVAPIEGVPYEPYGGPPEAEGKNRTKPGWTIAFSGARIRAIRELWIDTVRLRGQGDVVASVTVGPGQDKRISVESAEARFRESELAVKGNSLLEGLELHVEGRMEPFFTKQTRGKALLPLVTAEVDLSGTLDVPDVNALLRPGGGLELRGGRAKVSGHLDAGGERGGGALEVAATDLWVVNQGRGDQLQLVLDELQATLDPFALLDRTVRVTSVAARGAEFRLRKRPKTLAEAKAREGVVAPIEGVPFEPYPGPPEGPEKKKPGWTVAFDEAHVRDVRELWINDVRVRGEADVAARVTVGPGRDRRISIESADARFQDTTLAIKGNSLLRDLDLRVEGRMDPFFTKQTRGKALLPLVTADVHLSGDLLVPDVNGLLRPGGGLDLRSGRARVEGHLEARGGEEEGRGSLELAAADLVVVNQGRGDQLEVVVDELTADLDPMALFDRSVRVTSLDAQGVEFRLRKRPKTLEEAAARKDTVAPIEGVAFEPYSGPPEDEKKRKPGWTVAFAGARLRDVRELWIDDVHLRGAGNVVARVTVGPGRDKRISIQSADVRFGDTELAMGGHRLLTGLDLAVEGRMEPFYTKQTRGKALLPLVTAEVDVSGDLRLPDVNGVLGPGGGLDLRSGQATVKGRLQVGRGDDADRGALEVAATDVVVVNDGPGDQIEAAVDELRGALDPIALLSRGLLVTGLDARGVELRLRKRPKTAEEAAEKEPFVAPIAGLSFEPFDGPPKTGEEEPGWALGFSGTRLRDVRELWIDSVRLRGRGDLAAGIHLGPEADKKILIAGADLEFRDTELTLDGDVFIQGLDLRLEGRMEPFYTKRTRGLDLLPLVTVRLDISGTASTADILNRYFGKARWLEFTSGPGRIRAQLDLRGGQLQPGGFVELEEGALAARFAGFTAEGQARARFDSAPAEMGEHADAQLWVDFSEYGMRRRVEGPPALQGERLLIHARSSGDLKDFPPQEIDGHLQLGNAEFPDLAFLNGLIPPGVGLDVKAGRAVVDGTFRTGGEDASIRGGVTVTTTGLVLGAGGVEHAGDVKLAIQVPEGNLDEKLFRLDGTWLALDRFAFTSKGSAEDAPDFWGRLILTDGDLDLGETPRIDTRLKLGLSDTRPVVAFLSRDKPLAGWQERLLTVHGITGRADLDLTKETATFRHAEVAGEGGHLKGRVLIGDHGSFGKVLARWGILKIGVGVEGKEHDVKFFSAGNWYKKDDILGMPSLGGEPDGR